MGGAESPETVTRGATRAANYRRNSENVSHVSGVFPLSAPFHRPRRHFTGLASDNPKAMSMHARFARLAAATPNCSRVRRAVRVGFKYRPNHQNLFQISRARRNTSPPRCLARYRRFHAHGDPTAQKNTPCAPAVVVYCGVDIPVEHRGTLSFVVIRLGLLQLC